MKLAKRYFNNLVLVDCNGALYYSKYENTDLSIEEWLVESVKEIIEESELPKEKVKSFVKGTLKDIHILQSLDMEEKRMISSNLHGCRLQEYVLKRFGIN